MCYANVDAFALDAAKRSGIDLEQMNRGVPPPIDARTPAAATPAASAPAAAAPAVVASAPLRKPRTASGSLPGDGGSLVSAAAGLKTALGQ